MKTETDPAKLRVAILPSRAGCRPRAICGGRAGFTLIEMLVVFGLIAALAALIVGAASAGFNKRIRSRVQAERDALVNAIQYYKESKGFYPPDNPNNPATNSLFYELTGMTVANGSIVSVLGDSPDPANFNATGFLNASPDKSEVKNFYKTLKPSQYATNGSAVYLLVVPYKGPASPNTWRYNSSKPVHNPDSYDLWAEVIIGSKTITIGNWRD